LRRNVATATQPRSTSPHLPQLSLAFLRNTGRNTATAAPIPRCADRTKAIIPMRTPNVSTSTKNLVETVAANDSFKTFGKALEASGLHDTLKGAGPYTVFAPTDAAFEQLPAGRLDTLLQPENKAELASILNFHVVSGRRAITDISKWNTAKTLNGQSCAIKFDGTQMNFGGAQVTSQDIDSSNGVLHGIDKVNLPSVQ
jgi:uncharacterized surface protein with fasciclin (FAS1) repeats